MRRSSITKYEGAATHIYNLVTKLCLLAMNIYENILKGLCRDSFVALGKIQKNCEKIE